MNIIGDNVSNPSFNSLYITPQGVERLAEMGDVFLAKQIKEAAKKLSDTKNFDVFINSSLLPSIKAKNALKIDSNPWRPKKIFLDNFGDLFVQIKNLIDSEKPELKLYSKNDNYFKADFKPIWDIREIGYIAEVVKALDDFCVEGLAKLSKEDASSTSMAKNQINAILGEFLKK